MDSVSYVCPKHGLMVCPICGSVLVKLEYRGNKPNVLALAKRDDFCYFVGCSRTDLHNKIMNGVSYRGKVFVRAIFKADLLGFRHG